MRLGVRWWQQNSGAGQGYDHGAGWMRKQEQNPTEGSVQKVTESHQLVCVNGKMSGMSHSKGRTLNELPNLSWKNESSTKLSSTDTESPSLRNRHYLCSSARGKRGLSVPLSQNSVNSCHCFQHKHWVWGEEIIKRSLRLKNNTLTKTSWVVRGKSYWGKPDKHSWAGAPFESPCDPGKARTEVPQAPSEFCKYKLYLPYHYISWHNF